MPMRSFKRAAQDRVSDLFRTISPDDFLSELDTYAPVTSAERASHEKFRGWALYDAGEYDASRTYLMHSLRRSEPRSGDRSLAHGLLAETFLRVGRFDRAEECTRRALGEGCRRDPDHFLQAGHLLALGRIQAQRGQLNHALETFSRARALINERHPMWVPILTAIAEGHKLRGSLEEADAAVYDTRRAEYSMRQQVWGIAAVECPLAIALGDLDRADRSLSEANSLGVVFGERIRLVLMEMQAMILQANRRHREAERLVRAIITAATPGGRNSDALASAGRVLTESLMFQNRYEEALETARMTARAGRVGDRVEWARALRMQGECFLGLGEPEKAKRAFREAMSVHACTQFEEEHRLLEKSARMAGFLEMVRSERTAPRKRSAGTVQRLVLRSGKVFLSYNSRLVETIRAAARTDLPVLIEGETGTGKELVSHLIHELGPRASAPLIIVDCTTLPETLADVELFGATRGAYTGAFRERAGLIAQADGGTLVLDELPELSTAIQAKLLRVVHEGVYRRVGEDRTRSVRVRFIAATNRSVQELMTAGALKPDLYYRLGGHRIELVPIRQRHAEVRLLAEEVARAAGRELTTGAIRVLEAQPWPGNVRQLEMIVRLSAATCPMGCAIDAAHLTLCIRESKSEWRSPNERDLTTLRSERLAAEREVLERLLREHAGVITDAARALGMSRQSFYKAMRRAGIKRSEHGHYLG